MTCRNRLYMRQWYRDRPGLAAERARARRQRDPEAARERDRQRYANDPVYRLKRLARSAVIRAVNAGRLERKPCEVCGALEVEAHHADYSRPLEVTWLCILHHVLEHVGA